jgi:hypothetical protein
MINIKRSYTPISVVNAENLRKKIGTKAERANFPQIGETHPYPY